MRIKVDCYSGYKGNERPMRFFLGNRSIQVEEVVDRWYGEHGSYFRVLGNDENLYILKGPVEDGLWELISFTHRDSRGTELEFEGKRELQ
ncbi:MAG: hypothetical protein IH857_04955 [Deltaproteobacteria bacterium]|nr:hypothetical protein [Deltaproteobacteria bacterium]MCZ6623592.1 hypothetical protein [Deltaproteobacteria bacterium]